MYAKKNIERLTDGQMNRGEHEKERWIEYAERKAKKIGYFMDLMRLYRLTPRSGEKRSGANLWYSERSEPQISGA